MLASDRQAHEEAVEHFDACEVLAEASWDSHLVALCLLNRAEVLLAIGRTEQARRDAASAERGFEALGAHFNAADVHWMIALCDRADGLLGQAETRLKQARELAKMTGARLTAAETARDLGRIYAETGRMKEAHGALREAAQGFEGLGATADAEATGRELARLVMAGAGR